VSQSRQRQRQNNSFSEQRQQQANSATRDKSKTRSMSRLSRQGTFTESDMLRTQGSSSRQTQLCRPKSQDYSVEPTASYSRDSNTYDASYTQSRPVSGPPSLPPRKHLGALSRGSGLGRASSYSASVNRSSPSPTFTRRSRPSPSRGTSRVI